LAGVIEQLDSNSKTPAKQLDFHETFNSRVLPKAQKKPSSINADNSRATVTWNQLEEGVNRSNLHYQHQNPSIEPATKWYTYFLRQRNYRVGPASYTWCKLSKRVPPGPTTQPANHHTTLQVRNPHWHLETKPSRSPAIAASS
jgi:hypothetical protein